ncbi:fibronectin type III domain-containing protein [Kitasatospora sp. NPDC048722]|uniref:fibronectin type III domain-containing protein n=1 Tax=Kitasatospora sp. NPDC048722 TaxID=3155639 RepID=UPI0034093B42
MKKWNRKLAAVSVAGVMAGVAVTLSAPVASAVPPAAPSVSVAPAATSVAVSWSQVGDVEGYQVSDGLTTRFVNVNQNTYTWGGLAQGTYKCFHVRAINGQGETGAWSPYKCTTTTSNSSPSHAAYIEQVRQTLAQIVPPLSDREKGVINNGLLCLQDIAVRKVDPKVSTACGAFVAGVVLLGLNPPTAE